MEIFCVLSFDHAGPDVGVVSQRRHRAEGKEAAVGTGLGAAV
jgi:hypothetical protein